MPLLSLLLATPSHSDTPWLRAGLDLDRPAWGLRDGIMVGLWPDGGGPRGLIRILYPLGEPRAHHLVNFIAVEPDVGDGHWRGLSETEHSDLDGLPGKRFAAEPPPGAETWDPAQGLYPGFIDHPPDAPEAERLRLCLRTEAFRNGAHPYLILTLRTDHPDEVMLEIFHEPDSKPMRMGVLTATMGNYARLRRAHLAEGKVISSLELWPAHTGGNFTDFRTCPLPRLARTTDGGVIVPMECDEGNPPANWPHDPGIWWRWSFEKLTQYWRKPPGTFGEDLEFAANSRATYYGSPGLTIPGGVAFENAELRESYQPGRLTIFGLSRLTPAELLQQWPGK